MLFNQINYSNSILAGDGWWIRIGWVFAAVFVAVHSGIGQIHQFFSGGSFFRVKSRSDGHMVEIT